MSRMIHASRSHYDHVGAFYHSGLGQTFVTSTVTLMDVRAGTSTIARGARSDAVAQLQTLLNALKFRDQEGKALVVDKLFGARTENALKSAQAAIRAQTPTAQMMDGVLDQTTLAALELMQAGKPVTPEVLPRPQPPSEGGADASSESWWMSPWVLGGAAVALVAAVAYRKKKR